MKRPDASKAEAVGPPTCEIIDIPEKTKKLLQKERRRERQRQNRGKLCNVDTPESSSASDFEDSVYHLPSFIESGIDEIEVQKPYEITLKNGTKIHVGDTAASTEPSVGSRPESARRQQDIGYCTCALYDAGYEGTDLFYYGDRNGNLKGFLLPSVVNPQ